MESNLAVVQDTEVFDSVKQEGYDVLVRARELSLIHDNEQFKAAGEYRAMLNRAKKDALAKLEPARGKAYAAYQEVLKLIKEVISPFDEAILILDGPLGKWDEEQRRLRRIEDEKRVAEAKRQAEEAQLKAAEEAQKAGNHAKAEAILNKPVVAPAISTPKPEGPQGVSFRENWKIDSLVNMSLLVAAANSGKVPIEALMPNEKFLNQMAKALKDKLNYPGVTVKCEKVVASR